MNYIHTHGYYKYNLTFYDLCSFPLLSYIIDILCHPKYISINFHESIVKYGKTVVIKIENSQLFKLTLIFPQGDFTHDKSQHKREENGLQTSLQS